MSKIELNITTDELTSTLKQTFGNVYNLYLFLIKNINDPETIAIDKEKLTLHKKGSATVYLYFSNFKKYDKS